jgi:hypothetical protein
MEAEILRNFEAGFFRHYRHKRKCIGWNIGNLRGQLTVPHKVTDCDHNQESKQCEEYRHDRLRNVVTVPSARGGQLADQIFTLI